jgi:hypothetical protein
MKFSLPYDRKQIPVEIDDRNFLDLDGSLLSSDYTSGDLPSSKRLDFEYVASARLDYSFNAHISANLAYEFDAGRNDLAGVVNSEMRAFDRNLISVGVLVKF